MRAPAIVASVLGADYARLGHEVADLEAAGVDRIQWDVMDGRFVPNLSFGADVVAACRPHATVPYEAHLMVEDPDPWLQPFAAAGCDTVLVHAEASRHLQRTLSRIRELGVRPGVALNPATPLEWVRHVLDLVDVLLVMTVKQGLEVVLGKLIWELRPAVPSDKGDAVRKLLAESGARSVVVAGDDLGDLAAFAAAAQLAREGGDALRVAVRSAEAPEPLLAAADLVVEGPPGLREFLERLAAPPGSS